MEFECQKSSLHEAIASASRFISARPTHPILGHIKLSVNVGEAVGGEALLSVTGFDLSSSLRVDTPVSAKAFGTITLPSKTLLDAVSTMPPGTVKIKATQEEHGNGVTVSLVSGKSRYNLRGTTGDDYPELPQIKSEPIAISKQKLTDGLSAVLYAASSDETKQVLTGVNIAITKGEITFATTDGHRLAVLSQSQTNKSEVQEDFAVTLPAIALSELNRLLAKEPEESDILIQLDKGQALFPLRKMALTCRVLDGGYPNYEMLIPSDFARRSLILKEDLLGAIARCSCISGKEHLIKLIFEESALTICSSQNEVGDIVDTIPASTTGDNDKFTLSLNSKYLMDSVKSIKTKEVLMKMNTPGSPIVITPVGGDFSKTIHLLMPVQITS